MNCANPSAAPSALFGMIMPQYTWLAPHDVAGLVGCFGSRARMLEKLDSLFTRACRVQVTRIHGGGAFVRHGERDVLTAQIAENHGRGNISPVFAQGSNGGVGGGFSSRDGGSLGSHTDPIRIPRRGRTQINFQGSRRSRGDGTCQ